MYEIWILVYFWGKYMYSVLCKLKQISEPTPSPPQKKMEELQDLLLHKNIMYHLLWNPTKGKKLLLLQTLNFLCRWDVKTKTWEITDALRPTVVNLDFQKGGKTVFKSVNFAGYIGILTAVKPVRFRICPLRSDICLLVLYENRSIFTYIDLNYLLWEPCSFCCLGISKGMFTLTMNERFNMDGGYIGKPMF